MRIERKPYNDVLVVPEQKYRCIPNTVRVPGHDLQVIVCSEIEDHGWFSVQLPTSHPFKKGDVVEVGGRHSISRVSIEGFFTYIDTPTWSGSRPPWCEDLKVIPRGEYRFSKIREGGLAVLTKI